MLAEERKTLVEQYRAGYEAVAEALLKITPEELDVQPGPGRWSVREILHHLADRYANCTIVDGWISFDIEERRLKQAGRYVDRVRLKR